MSFSTNIPRCETVNRAGLDYSVVLDRLQKNPETLNFCEYKIINYAVKRYEKECSFEETFLVRKALKKPIEHWIAALEYALSQAISISVAEITPTKKPVVMPKTLYYKNQSPSYQNRSYRVTYRYLALTKNEWKKHVLNNKKKEWQFNLDSNFNKEQKKIVDILSYTRITYQIAYNHNIHSWIDENSQLQVKISLGYGLAGLFSWRKKVSCDMCCAFSEESNFRSSSWERILSP